MDTKYKSPKISFVTLEKTKVLCSSAVTSNPKCPRCYSYVGRYDNYCKHCGQKLK